MIDIFSEIRGDIVMMRKEEEILRIIEKIKEFFGIKNMIKEIKILIKGL